MSLTVTVAYKGHLISTVVDRPLVASHDVAYKGHLISTVVDHELIEGVQLAYKGHLISTVVDPFIGHLCVMRLIWFFNI